MKSYLLRMHRFFAVVLLAFVLGGCINSTSDNLDLSANENGSSPVNDKEAVDYKKALLRCYKSGGSRVVKVLGQLRCY